MSKASHEYILGSSKEEIQRLAFQHEVWADETHKLWDRAAIGYGDTVVDLGSGPGFATLEISRLVGDSGHVYAVDASEKFEIIVMRRISSLAVGNVTFLRGDAGSLDVEEGSADHVFARWLFSFLEEPETAIDESRRVLKPGGKLVVFDYFNYLGGGIFPEPNVFADLFTAYGKNVELNRGSYTTGDRMPAMMAKAGFEIEELVPICRIARPGSNTWKWVELFNDLAVPSLIENGLWNESQAEEFFRNWKKAANEPGTFFFTPPMLGIVGVKR